MSKMKLRINDEVNLIFRDVQSKLTGKVLGAKQLKDGVYYKVCLTMDSREVLTLNIHEDQLTLTPAYMFMRAVESL
jgi:hypothetical protein